MLTRKCGRLGHAPACKGAYQSGLPDPPMFKGAYQSGLPDPPMFACGCECHLLAEANPAIVVTIPSNLWRETVAALTDLVGVCDEGDGPAYADSVTVLKSIKKWQEGKEQA